MLEKLEKAKEAKRRRLLLVLLGAFTNHIPITTGASDHISLLCCVSAAGLPLPPMIIYSKSFPGGPYRFDGPDDALYAKSDSGKYRVLD